MNSKIRLSLLVAGVMGLSNVVIAQTVEQGKKFIYYQRYKSAKETLEKVLASNPNNIEATYWLGQDLLALKDSVAAEGVYSKALQSNGNAPLLLVGMGQVELRKGKTADARQRFETAISLTKGKDVGVLNAIGLANADANGDATYAIEKLNLATQTKNFNNAETYLTLGDAYRKLIDGGNAVQSYQKALTLDPKLAAAKYKIGMIYLTQNNKEYFLPAFEEAITLDPSYAPVLYQLYDYYFYRDINKSIEYFNKYIAVADATPQLEYYKAMNLYGAGRNDDAISTAKATISAMGDKAEPRYYRLIAYSYDNKGDSVNARDFMQQYFSKVKPEDLTGTDYANLGKFLGKFSGNDENVYKNYRLAVDKDTLLENKVKLTKEVIDYAKKTANKSASAEWAGRLYGLAKNPTNTDLYNWGISNYQAGNYKTADSIFCGIYEQKYPNEIFGYLWCARSLAAQDDSTNSKGLAVEAYEKLAVVARGMDSTAKVANSADSIKYKPQILQSYFFLAQYYNDIKKDKPTAILYLRKVLEVDPTNTMAGKFIDILSKPAPATRPRPAGTAAKPAGK